jgi:hypothetical protein
MAICPECQKENMTVIGTEKFNCTENESNFSVAGYSSKIFITNYCKKCNIMVFREPDKVYG